MPAKKKEEGVSLPVKGMLLLGILGAIGSGLSFEVIKFWPLPVSIVPPFGGDAGFIWGLVVGAISGYCIGYLVDDKHFSDSGY